MKVQGAVRWVLVGLAVLLAMVPKSMAPSARALPEPHLGYGINVRNPTPEQLGLISELGLGWIKLWSWYTPIPTERLPYNVLFLFECPGYISDLEAWGDYVDSLARAGKGKVEAYEVCSEPNLSWLWEGQPPDPARYVEMLCVAYERIKAVDPMAVVLNGGMAPTGRIQGNCNGWPGNNCAAMDERTYVEAMVERGAGACMDAFAHHPYGFAYEPERDPTTVENTFTFRNTEILRQILVQHGLEDMRVWATEFNWIRYPAEDGDAYCHQDPVYEHWFGWMDVSAQTQADYLVRAFRYADEHWPWMHVMTIWNLDWHNYGWPCEPSRYFSIRQYDGSDLGAPSPAYWAFAALEKRPGPFEPQLKVQPDRLLWLADVDEPAVFTTTVMVRNVGYHLLSWTAAADQAGGIVPTLPVTTGAQGEPLTIEVDTKGLEIGSYAGTVTVTAMITDVLNSPCPVSLEVRVVPEVLRLYIPLTSREW